MRSIRRAFRFRQLPLGGVLLHTGGKPDAPFKWTFHLNGGQSDLEAVYFDMWDQVATNHVYGAMWPNDAGGNTYRKSWPAILDKHGWTWVDGGAFQAPYEDFKATIAAFKNGGAEVIAGQCDPPEFANFWKQAKQQDFHPKIVTVGKAYNFPQALETIGNIGFGLSTVSWWGPAWPFRSSLSGETCQEIADDYEKRTGNQWTQAIFDYALCEVAVAALKQTADVDSKESILAALLGLKFETVVGPIDLTLPVKQGSLRPVHNVYRTPCSAGQWTKGTGKWFADFATCSNAGWPAIPVQAKLQSLA